MTISFFVQGIPVAKGRARITTVGGFPKAYTPQKTRDYETQVAWQAKSAMNGFPPLVGPLECEISIFLPIPKSRKKTFDGDPHIV
jgi:Holliday junction resolvase RusA-like endonuclease